ncbi:hypothetical protein [Horticoccus sp. 23ND18S-11]|uniref:hypothetical protein n=1 Tax=Horticoccus sp. 23ND18S-11 TaxID=3391832 RepID=UPI0039C98027
MTASIPTSDRSTARVRSWPTLLLMLGLVTSPGSAQVAPVTPAVTSAADPKQDAIVLSPFSVNASSDTGYAATSTLGGTRLKSELRDVASQIDVMTSEFLDDIGALTLDEALRYSMNIESNDENFSPGTDPNTNSVFSSAYGSRTRGLSRSNNTHDFFETNVPLDTYNTGKRFTLVSGSNAILFGAGFAGGTNDVAFDRPDLRKFSGNTTIRADSNGSLRASLNLSQPLIRNVLGLRVAGLRADERDYREGVGSKTDRFFASLLLQPIKRLAVRGWLEKYESRQRNAANTLVADRVSPWLATSTRPTFNNAGLTPTSTAAQFTTAFNAQGADLARSAERFNNVASAGTVVFNVDGTQPTSIRNWTNTVTSSRPLDGTQDPSIVDPSIYPLDRSVVGNAMQRRWRSSIHGFVFEVNPWRDIYIEGGYNREVFDTRSLSFLSGNNTDLRVDLNRFLPDGATPNPNLGRYYVEDDITGSMWRNHRSEQRLQVAFAQDLEKRGGFWRWLGSHQGAVMYTGGVNMRVQQNNNNTRIISDNTFDGITYPAGTNAANDAVRNTRRLRTRFYLDTPQNNSGRGQFELQAPFNLWDSETRVIGKDSVGRDVVVNSGMSNPYGAQVATSNGKKKEDALQWGLQSSFLQGRLNLTIGERFSDASFAPWVGQGGATSRLPRRYNAATGKYEEPVRNGAAIVFPSNGQAVGNAGFEPWDAMLSRGGEFDSLEAPTEYSVTSRMKGVVLHPLGRNAIPSLHYTESSSAFVADFTRKSPNGAEAQLDDGTTREYGLSLRFLENKLVLRVNAYESIYLGVSGGAITVPNPTAAGGNSGMDRADIRWTAIHIEKSVQNYNLVKSGGRYESAATGAPVLGGTNTGIDAASPIRYLQEDVLSWPSEGAAGTAFSLKYNNSSDRIAKGLEYRLIANPTRGWSVSASLAKNNTRSARIAADWFGVIGYRLKDWLAAANDTAAPQRAGGTGPTQLHFNAGTNANETLLAYMRSAALGWAFLRESEGQANNQEVEWRGNLTSSYRIQSGPLKGVRFGGSARYRGDRILGYRDKTINVADLANDPILGVPGLFPAGSSITLADVAKPIMGGATVNTDAVLGYSMALFNKRVRWNVSLNVRNLLDDDKLIAQSGLSSNGAPVVFQYPEPRVFLLTNSFDF